MFFSFSRSAVARRVRATVVAGIGALLLFASAAYAQHDHVKLTAPPLPTGAAITGATPDAAGTPVPLQFESKLSRYKAMTDQKLGSWREANNTVTRIGGWRTYLKESQAPDSTTPESPATSPKPVVPSAPITPNPHAGHGAKP